MKFQLDSLKKKRNRIIKQHKNEASNRIFKMFDKNGKLKIAYDEYDDTPATYSFEEIIQEMNSKIKKTHDIFNEKECNIIMSYEPNSEDIIMGTAVEFIEEYWDGVANGSCTTLNNCMDFDDGGVSKNWSKEDCINAIFEGREGLKLAIWFLSEMVFWRGYEVFLEKYYRKMPDEKFVNRSIFCVNNKFFVFGYENYTEVFPTETKITIYK